MANGTLRQHSRELYYDEGERKIGRKGGREVDR
jgi:hypothetical protein